MHDINIIDHKEEKMNLIETKYETKGTVRQPLDELYKEEMFWMQRAKVTWLKEGDKNIEYFYKVASRRKGWNQIVSLRYNDKELTSSKDIALKFHEFLLNLFSKASKLVICMN